MNTKSLVSGAVCVGIGAFFAGSAVTSLKIGTSTNMGPGFFPLALAIILMLAGVYIAVKALAEDRGGFRFDIAGLPWRGIVLLSLAPIMLGATLRGLGLLACVFLTSMISAYASSTQTLRLALIVSVLLSAFCTLIFGYVLKLPIPIVGPWLGF